MQYNIFTNYILKSILETSTSTSDAASSYVFHLDPPPVPTDTDVMDTETSGMQSTSTCTSSRAGATPSDKITEVGSSGISTGPQNDETEYIDEQQHEEHLLDQAQTIIDEGYVKLVHLNKLLRKQPDSEIMSTIQRCKHKIFTYFTFPKFFKIPIKFITNNIMV